MTDHPQVVLVIGTHDIADLDFDLVLHADIVISMIGGEARMVKNRYGPEGPVKVIDKQKHILVIGPEAWSLEHPIQCKGEFSGLQECPVQAEVQNWMKTQGDAPMPPGRYAIKSVASGIIAFEGKGPDPVKIWGVCRHCDHASGRHYPGISADRLCDIKGCDCPGFIDRHDRFVVEQDTDPDPDGEEDPRATGESWVIVDTSDETFHSDWFTQRDAIKEAQKLNTKEEVEDGG